MATCNQIFITLCNLTLYLYTCSSNNHSNIDQSALPILTKIHIRTKIELYVFHIDSALDKLLGQLGTYATWLSSIAYLQKQLRIFIFLRHVFFCDYTISYCMKPSGMCLHIYSLPSSAFLKYQTRGFYCS